MSTMILRKLGISIHALRMEGDNLWMPARSLTDLFQSTPSAWRATSSKPASRLLNAISIHALRMEGDEKKSSFEQYHSRISIHALRMEGDGQRNA